MGRFLSKRIEIEALPWDGTEESTVGIVAWAASYGNPKLVTGQSVDGGPWQLTVLTLNGPVPVNPGEWVIRGMADEFYPCDPAVFEAKYEPKVDE